MSMIVDESISYSSILYGLIFHFDLKRPVLFLTLKILGKFAFSVSKLKQMRGKARYYAKMYLKKLNQILIKNHKNGPYICGEKFTLADLAWIPVLERLYASGSDDLLDLDNDENNLLHKYWDNLKKRKCYQKAIYEWKMNEKCPIMGRSEKRLSQWIDSDTNDRTGLSVCAVIHLIEMDLISPQQIMSLPTNHLFNKQKMNRTQAQFFWIAIQKQSLCSVCPVKTECLNVSTSDELSSQHMNEWIS